MTLPAFLGYIYLAPTRNRKMVNLFVISIVIFILAMLAMEINRRRLNEDQLRILKRATFQDRWWLYLMVFTFPALVIIFGGNKTLFSPLPLVCLLVFLVTWGLIVQRRIFSSHLPKNFIKTDFILSIIQLVTIVGVLTYVTFLYETK